VTTIRNQMPDADTAGCEGAGRRPGEGPVGTKGSQRILTKAGTPKNGRVVWLGDLPVQLG
jgi:hypothetical protein